MELPNIPLDRETLKLPVELMTDGLTLTWDFGLRSLAELARTASLAGLNVLEGGSIRAEEGGVVLTLRNPPLRIGASKAIRVFWDRVRVADADVRLEVRGEPPGVTLDKVNPEHPFSIPVGRRTDVHLSGASSTEGSHRLRMELDPLAIPPMLYWETEVRVGKPGPLAGLI